MNVEASRERLVGRLDHLPRALYLVFGAWVFGLTLGEVVFLLLMGYPSVRGPSSPIWFGLFFSALAMFFAMQVRLTLVRLAFLVVAVDMLLCSTGLAGHSTTTWTMCLLADLTFGGLLILAGWSTSRRLQIFAILVVVAGVEARYLTIRYWHEVVKPYRSVISAGVESKVIAV